MWKKRKPRTPDTFSLSALNNLLIVVIIAVAGCLIGWHVEQAQIALAAQPIPARVPYPIHQTLSGDHWPENKHQNSDHQEIVP